MNLILLTFPKSKSVPLELYRDAVEWIERNVARSNLLPDPRVVEIAKSAHGTTVFVSSSISVQEMDDVKREMVAEMIAKEFEVSESKQFLSRFGVPFVFIREQTWKESVETLEKGLNQRDSIIEKLYDKIHKLESNHKTKVHSHKTSRGEEIRLERLRLDRKLETAHELMMREKEKEIQQINNQFMEFIADQKEFFQAQEDRAVRIVLKELNELKEKHRALLKSKGHEIASKPSPREAERPQRVIKAPTPYRTTTTTTTSPLNSDLLSEYYGADLLNIMKK